MWDVRFSKNAEKDKRLLKEAGLEDKTKQLLDILRIDPFRNPPSYEKHVGDLKGFYARRSNLQHRLVYKVDLEAKVVEVRAMWTHDER